jgi:hypothetical protein
MKIFTTTTMRMILMTRMKKGHFVDPEVPTNYAQIAAVHHP